MSYQFLHVETYARTPSKKGGERASVAAVFAEARREAGYCPHVEQPRPPVRIYGQPLRETETEILATAGAARDKRGHQLRKDAQIMIAGVASFPTPSSEIQNSEAERQRYTAWRDGTIKFLQREYGPALKTVILHTDEQFPHLHFYIAPELRPDGTLGLDDLHRGRKAQSSAGTPQERMKAYKEAMRSFQADYHDQVTANLGMTRRGPGRRRLSRSEWKAEQEQAKREAKQREDLAKLQQQLADTKHQLGSRISQDRIRAREKIGQIEKQLSAWKTRAEDAEIHLHHTREELKGEKRKAREAVRSSGGFNPSTADLPGLDRLTPPKPDTPVY